MEGFAFYALIGLPVLVLLELALLIVAVLLRKRDIVPKVVVPPVKEQERYGWEDMLKLAPKAKPSRRQNTVLAVIVVALLALIVAVPGWFLVSPFFPLSNQTANETIIEPEPVVPIEPVVNETSIFSNLSLRLNITVPDINLSGVIEPIKAHPKAFVSLVIAVLVAIAAYFLIARRKKLAVIRKARKTAEKLMAKAAEAGSGKKPKKAGNGLFSWVKKARNYIAPAIILFLLIIIAFLIYLLRGRIRDELPEKLLSGAVVLKGFILNYRSWIAGGIVLLVILVIVLKGITSRHKSGNSRREKASISEMQKRF